MTDDDAIDAKRLMKLHRILAAGTPKRLVGSDFLYQVTLRQPVRDLTLDGLRRAIDAAPEPFDPR